MSAINECRGIFAALPSAVETACDEAFSHGICVALQVVYASGYSVLWREIIVTAGEDKILHFAAFTEPEEWRLTGLHRWARPILKRGKPRRPK